ncbi:hypothetical protein AaE_004056 [Aphanomyces astaci]|uniref:Uncharacterized protein n=1 Tax=Aphanomyces astaci TaxID=112090 RepID=A0A6A5AQ49_APHAT|nr:hypothetical protein AaE_004056 [Aphanomyces astaci]
MSKPTKPKGNPRVADAQLPQNPSLESDSTSRAGLEMVGKDLYRWMLAAIKAKRNALFATHDPPSISRPSDADLDIAIDALTAANLTGDHSELRSRALLRCPTKSAENHTMWIPAKKIHNGPVPVGKAG